MKKIFIAIAITFLITTQLKVLAEEIQPAPATDIKSRLELASKIINPNGKKRDPKYTLDSAKPLLEQNLTEDPNHAESYYTLASYYIVKGDMVQAMANVEKALVANPKYNEALFGRAQLLYMQGNIAEARQIKDSGLGLNKDELKFNEAVELSTVLLLFKDLDNVHVYYQLALTKAANDPEKSMANSFMGNYFLLKQDYKKCVEYKEKAVFFDLENANENAGLANCYLKNKQYELGMRSAQRSMFIMDTDVAKVLLIVAYELRSKELMTGKKYAEAEEILNQSIALYNKNPKTYVELMKSQVKQEKTEMALATAQKAIDKSNNNIPELILSISKVFKNKASDYSLFMEKLASELTNPAHLGLVTYSVADTLELMDQKAESSKWIAKGKALLSKGDSGRAPASEAIDNLVLMANFSLLNLKIDKNNLNQLEEANLYFKQAKKLDVANPKVVALDETLKATNTKFGRNPASVFWKAKLFLCQYITVSLPDWMSF